MASDDEWDLGGCLLRCDFLGAKLSLIIVWGILLFLFVFLVLSVCFIFGKKSRALMERRATYVDATRSAGSPRGIRERSKWVK